MINCAFLLTIIFMSDIVDKENMFTVIVQLLFNCLIDVRTSKVDEMQTVTLTNHH